MARMHSSALFFSSRAKKCMSSIPVQYRHRGTCRLLKFPTTKLFVDKQASKKKRSPKCLPEFLHWQFFFKIYFDKGNNKKGRPNICTLLPCPPPPPSRTPMAIYIYTYKSQSTCIESLVMSAVAIFTHI